jgi:hypothetical protein
MFNRITCFEQQYVEGRNAEQDPPTSAAQYVRWQVKSRIVYKRQVESGVGGSYGICTYYTDMIAATSKVGSKQRAGLLRYRDSISGKTKFFSSTQRPERYRSYPKAPTPLSCG